MTELVLSLFPGIGLLDRAFEENGFCVVRGPDVLWGGDIKTFSPPASKFDGIIGGPPCQVFSSLSRMVRYMAKKHPGKYNSSENLIPEYERCVREARPTWWLMENVPAAPTPEIDGYSITEMMLNNRWLGEEQNRLRKFVFGHRDQPINLSKHIEYALFENPVWREAVLASGTRRAQIRYNGAGKPKKILDEPGAQKRIPLSESVRLQGLPEDFLKDAPFTAVGKQKVIGNGVPLPMGRALAGAIKQALEEIG